MRRANAIALLVAAVLALAGLGAVIAEAELSVSGNLFVTFDGGIFPSTLPRHGKAPITIRLSGKVRTLSNEHPPALRQVVIKLNRNGHLQTRGLQSCHVREVAALTSTEALAKCGDSLVGSGAYVTRTSFPEQPSYASRGRLLAFNSTLAGQTAILVHVYGKRTDADRPHLPLPDRAHLGHLRHRPAGRAAALAQSLRLPEADQPRPAPHLRLPRHALHLHLRRLLGTSGPA